MKKTDSDEAKNNKQGNNPESNGQDNEQDFICKDCKQKFANFLERVSHSCFSLLQCPNCTETFKNDFRLNLHVKMAHNNKGMKMSGSIPTKPKLHSKYPTRVAPKHICEICDRPIKRSRQFCINCTEAINSQREYNLRDKFVENSTPAEGSSQLWLRTFSSQSDLSVIDAARIPESDTDVKKTNTATEKTCNDTNFEEKPSKTTQRGRPKRPKSENTLIMSDKYLKADKDRSLSKNSKQGSTSKDIMCEKDQTFPIDSRVEKDRRTSRAEKDRSLSKDSKTEKDQSLSKAEKERQVSIDSRTEKDQSSSKDPKTERSKKAQDSSAGGRPSRKRILETDNCSPASTSRTNLSVEGRGRASKKLKSDTPVTITPKPDLVTVDTLIRSLPADCGILLKPCNEDDSNFKCPKCNKVFRNLKLGSAHYSLCPKNIECSRNRKCLVSPRDVKWVCSLCHLSFDLLSHLTTHKSSCLMTGDLKTSFRSTASGSEYKSRRRTCPKCCFECVSLIKYQEHPCERILRQYQSIAISIEPIVQLKEDYSGSYTYFECACKKIFYKKQVLKRHLRLHPHARSKNCVRTLNIPSKDHPTGNPMLRIKKEVVSRIDEEDSSDELDTSNDSETSSTHQPDKPFAKKEKRDCSLINKMTSKMPNRSIPSEERTTEFCETVLASENIPSNIQQYSQPTTASESSSVSAEPIDLVDSRPQTANSDIDMDFFLMDHGVCKCGGNSSHLLEEDIKPCMKCLADLIKLSTPNPNFDLRKIKQEVQEVVQNAMIIDNEMPIDITDLSQSNSGPNIENVSGLGQIEENLSSLGLNASNLQDLELNVGNLQDLALNVGNLPDLGLNVGSLPDLGLNAGNLSGVGPNIGNIPNSEMNSENPPNSGQNDHGNTAIALQLIQDIQAVQNPPSNHRYLTPPATPDSMNVQSPSSQSISVSEPLNQSNTSEVCRSGINVAPPSDNVTPLPSDLMDNAPVELTVEDDDELTIDPETIPPKVRHIRVSAESHPPDAYAVILTDNDTENVTGYICNHCFLDFQLDSLVAHVRKKCLKPSGEDIVAVYVVGKLSDRNE